MPVMDGLTATRHIRAYENELGDVEQHPLSHALDDEKTRHNISVESTDEQKSAHQKHAKIIALTGLASQEAKHEAFTSGIDTFVTKPVRLAELNRILEGKDRADAEEHTSPTKQTKSQSDNT
jgi:CheY-like chemotaxis protein